MGGVSPGWSVGVRSPARESASGKSLEGPSEHRRPGKPHLTVVDPAAKVEATEVPGPMVGRGRRTAAAEDGGPRPSYQIWARWASGRTIGSPALQPKAFANAGIFERGPLVRNFGGA